MFNGKIHYKWAIFPPYPSFLWPEKHTGHLGSGRPLSYRLFGVLRHAERAGCWGLGTYELWIDGHFMGKDSYSLVNHRKTIGKP